jgi:inner membrane transporter RhtA
LTARGTSTPPILPIAALIAAMISLQLGAALAKSLFPAVGAEGAAALRLALAAPMLLAYWRPWRMHPARGEGCEGRALLIYGLAMGFMNLAFYSALRTVPLGIVVAVEFTGPLAVAMAASRRAVDFLWVALAAAGLLALLLPRGASPAALDPRGIAFALAAAGCWALYIVYGRRAGAAHGGRTTALGMAIAALAVIPIGIAHAGAHLLLPALLPTAVAVALLSSALPYSLEMFSLTRMPTRTFGVFMSVEPALGALAGLAFLGERLSALQWGAVACVMVASAGSAATGRDGGLTPE